MKENKKTKMTKTSMKVLAGAVTVSVAGLLGVWASNPTPSDIDENLAAVVQKHDKETVVNNAVSSISINDSREKALDEIQKYYENLFGYCEINYDEENNDVQIAVSKYGMDKLQAEAEKGKSDLSYKWLKMERYINKMSLSLEEKFEENGLGRVYVTVSLCSEFDTDRVLYSAVHGKSFEDYKKILNI